MRKHHSLAVVIATGSLLAIGWLVCSPRAPRPDSPQPTVTSSDEGVGRDEEENEQGHPKKTGSPPALSAKLGDARTDEIKSLIRELANTENVTVRLPPSLMPNGVEFAPVQSAQRMMSSFLMEHRLEQPQVLMRLVDIGPKALPHLLEALDDKTPTQATIEHSYGAGAMWYREDDPFSEIPIDLFSEDTANSFSLNMASKINPYSRKTINEYTVRIGDLCYVIIGQITNRHYLSVRYQLSSSIVINSPIRNAKLVDDTRKLWTSTDSRQMLWESLRRDIDNGRSREGAIVRLGYYFPAKSEELLLGLLPTIDYTNPDEPSLLDIRLLKAISLSKSRAVRSNITEIMKTTPNESFFAATLPAFDRSHDEVVLRRCKELLDALPDETDQGRQLLQVIGERFPGKAKAIYRNFVDSNSLGRRDTMCSVLWSKHPLGPEILTPLLDDKRPLESFSIARRVCDCAAQALSNYSEAISFDGEASEARKNKQIEKIKLHYLGIGVR